MDENLKVVLWILMLICLLGCGSLAVSHALLQDGQWNGWTAATAGWFITCCQYWLHPPK